MKKQLKEIRVEMEYSLSEVAKGLNLGVSTIEHFENNPGEIPMSIAVQFLSFYGISFSEVKFSI